MSNQMADTFGAQRSVARIGATMALAFLSGCGLILDFDPPDGPIFECTALVRSADGQVERVSSRTSPDFIDTTDIRNPALREYFNCSGSNCPSSCPRADSVANTETDWASWLGIRVREQSTVATSVFGQFDGPWCVEPGTLSCAAIGGITAGVSCDPLPAGDPTPLPVCAAPPPPPPGDPCLRVECDGVAPCEMLDFGDMGVGDTATRTVSVSNCGGTAAPDIALVLSGDILAEVLIAQRDFAVTRNECLPDTADEILAGEEILTNPLTDAVNSRCEFDVTFSPLSPFAYGAEIAFRSDLDPRHQILLRGNGIGGSLTTMPSLPDPTVCFDTPASPCTAPQSLAISNSGPGAVIISDVVLDSGGPNFEILAPSPASLPITLRAGDPPFRVTARWCSAPMPAETIGQVTISTNSPTTPTILMKLIREPAGCP